MMKKEKTKDEWIEIEHLFITKHSEILKKKDTLETMRNHCESILKSINILENECGMRHESTKEITKIIYSNMLEMLKNFE